MSPLLTRVLFVRLLSSAQRSGTQSSTRRYSFSRKSKGEKDNKKPELKKSKSKTDIEKKKLKKDDKSEEIFDTSLNKKKSNELITTNKQANIENKIEIGSRISSFRSRSSNEVNEHDSSNIIDNDKKVVTFSGNVTVTIEKDSDDDNNNKDYNMSNSISNNNNNNNNEQRYSMLGNKKLFGGYRFSNDNGHINKNVNNTSNDNDDVDISSEDDESSEDEGIRRQRMMSRIKSASRRSVSEVFQSRGADLMNRLSKGESDSDRTNYFIN